MTDGIPGEVLDGNAFKRSLTCYLTTGGYQMPYFDYNNLSVVYLETPDPPSGTHTVNVTATWCNEANLHILDYVLVESPRGVVDS